MGAIWCKTDSIGGIISIVFMILELRLSRLKVRSTCAEVRFCLLLNKKCYLLSGIKQLEISDPAFPGLMNSFTYQKSGK